MDWSALMRVVTTMWVRLLPGVVGLLYLASCGSGTTTGPLPTVPVGDRPIPSATPASIPTAPAALESTLTPSSAPLPSKPFTLNILSPLDGMSVEAEAVRVMGTTSGVTVGINGIPVDVAPDGSFQHDLPIEQGENLVEVVASNPSGRTKTQHVTVTLVPPVAGLPLTLLYPQDGLELAKPVVSVVGVTRPDAVVGVNEAPVEVNALGIFTTDLSLEEGANLIEAVAADIQDNVRVETAAVFYVP